MARISENIREYPRSVNLIYLYLIYLVRVLKKWSWRCETPLFVITFVAQTQNGKGNSFASPHTVRTYVYVHSEPQIGPEPKRHAFVEIIVSPTELSQNPQGQPRNTGSGSKQSNQTRHTQPVQTGYPKRLPVSELVTSASG